MEVDHEVKNVEMQAKVNTRETWAGRWEYILSLFGYMSGAGDFWRFPYLLWKNGGGSFMVVFILAVIICSIPVYYLEVTISQYSGKGMYNVWCICPLFSGLSVTMFIINAIILLVFPTVRVWIMSYIRHSFQSVLPWTTCGNSWNTDLCDDNRPESNKMNIHNITEDWNNSYPIVDETKRKLINSSILFTTIPEEEFWRYELLKESSGIEYIGNLNWELALYNFILRGLVVLCVIKSVKSIGKVMYVTTFIPFLLLLVVFIRVLALPGSKEGLIYLLKPNFEKLVDKQMWMEAGFLALNSVAIGMGGTLVIGSRGKFHTGIFRSTICACSMDVLGSIFVSFILFSVLGVMAAEQNKPLSSIVSSDIAQDTSQITDNVGKWEYQGYHTPMGILFFAAGTSVGFVGFTRAFSYLPAPHVWTVLFFTAALIAILDVIVMTKEVVVDFIMQWIPFCRNRHTLVVIIVFVASFVMSLPFETQAGPYIFQIAEWYYGSWCTLITTLLEIFICMWIFGGDRIDDILRTMIGQPMPTLLRILAAFICPIICMIFLLTSIILFRPPTYGNYHYPAAAEISGYCLGVLPVLPIPIVMAVKVYRMDGPLLKRFTKLLKPTNDWRPIAEDVRTENTTTSKREERSFSVIAYYNISGRFRKQNHCANDEMNSIPLYSKDNIE